MHLLSYFRGKAYKRLKNFKEDCLEQQTMLGASKMNNKAKDRNRMPRKEMQHTLTTTRKIIPKSSLLALISMRTPPSLHITSPSLEMHSTAYPTRERKNMARKEMQLALKTTLKIILTTSLLTTISMATQQSLQTTSLLL